MPAENSYFFVGTVGVPQKLLTFAIWRETMTTEKKLPVKSENEFNNSTGTVVPELAGARHVTFNTEAIKFLLAMRANFPDEILKVTYGAVITPVFNAELIPSNPNQGDHDAVCP